MTAALAIGLGAGSAFGYFTTSGVGQGSASTASMLPVTGAAATPTTLLVPGGTVGVTLSLTNPNAFPITVVGASSAGPVLVDGSHMGCPPTSVAFIDQSGSLLQLGGNETATLILNAAASMSDSAPDACQGASFTIPLFITARTS